MIEGRIVQATVPDLEVRMWMLSASDRMAEDKFQGPEYHWINLVAMR